MGRPKYLKDLICPVCKKIFHPKVQGRKYCSLKCAYANRPKRGKIVKCETCKKNFYVRAGDKRKHWYCGIKCLKEAPKTKIKRKCKVCGKEYLVHRSQELWRGKSKFCSNKCKFKQMKKPTKNVLDILWSKVVKLKAGNKCEYCGKIGGLNSHHIFSRSNMCVRWDIENGVCLCIAHHIFGNMSAHKAPLEFAEWLKETRGKKWYNDLRKKASQICKFTNEDKQKIIINFEQIIKKYN